MKRITISPRARHLIQLIQMEYIQASHPFLFPLRKPSSKAKLLARLIDQFSMLYTVDQRVVRHVPFGLPKWLWWLSLDKNSIMDTFLSMSISPK